MTHKLELYSIAASSACERVRIALELKGLDYETINIATLSNEDYLAVNPQRLMPTLKIDGRIVTQSIAMLEFLEEAHPEPALLPVAPVARAEVRAFAQIVASDIHPVGINKLRVKMQGDFGLTEDQTMAWYNDVAQSGFAVLEDILTRVRGAGPFCFGNAPTFADIVMVPHIHTAHARGVDFSGFPLVMSVFEHCVQHPAFVSAARENQ